MKCHVLPVVRPDTAKVCFCRDMGFGLCCTVFMPCRKAANVGKRCAAMRQFVSLNRKKGNLVGRFQ